MGTSSKEAASTPKRGKIKPVDIVSCHRRKIDEGKVADFINVLERDGRFLHPPTVRQEGATAYRLITGHHRLEASKRHFGEQALIEADIFPSDTPDALIELLEIEENLLRKELTGRERKAHTIRLAAALKKLAGESPVVAVSESSEVAESGKTIPSLRQARRGRGNKGMAQQVAEKLGIGKRAVNMRRKSAAAAIGETIDLDRDTPEELERKAAELERRADRRQHTERKVVRLKCRKPAPRGMVEDPMQVAKLQAGNIEGRIEGPLKVLKTMSTADQLLIVFFTCIDLGLDPLKMAPLEAFGLVEEEPELAVDLSAEVAPATDDAAVDAQAEQQDDAAQDTLATDDTAQGLLTTDDSAVHSQAEQQDHAADLGSEDLQDAGDGVSKAADQEPAGATKCAYCNIIFESGDQLEEFNGKLYHGFCVEDGKRLAKAKQGEQIAIAA